MHQRKFVSETMTRKTGTLIVLLFVLVQISYGQTLGQPKQLKVKGTYVHSPTMTEFPENIGTYQRQGVYSFDKRKENIGSTYKSGQTTLSVYLYPAGDGSEGRLRNQYLQALQDMADVSKSGLNVEQGYKFFRKDGYKINGFSAVTTDEIRSQLTLFECGHWFFKIRITTGSLDTAQINRLEQEALNALDPTRIAKKNPLDVKGKVYIAPAALGDSLMLSSAISGALEKLIWAKQNIDSTERIAGFPDIYLELHLNSWLKFNDFQTTKKYKSIPQNTKDYLSQLDSIIKAGYLEEFLMEQYNMVMVVPRNIVLDFASYDKWKADNPIKIDLSKKFYLVSYEEKN